MSKNKYVLSTKARKRFESHTTGEKALIGIHIEMASIPFPNVRLYWSKGRRYKLIADAMTLNRFSMLRNNLYLFDNLQENERVEDKYRKVRPILNQFLNVLLEELPDPKKRLCIDEQMIPFKRRLGLKQYMKGKPIP